MVTRKTAAGRQGKVALTKATASEILAAVKVSQAEQRRAKSAVDSVKRRVPRARGSKRVSSLEAK
jgi:hypothetical protein